MLKATPAEVTEALNFALKQRELGHDSHHVIKVLLDYHERLRYLLPVFTAVEHYLRSGQAENEHTILVKALEQARNMEAHRAHTDSGMLGLS
jgi:hypothetical protein